MPLTNANYWEMDVTMEFENVRDNHATDALHKMNKILNRESCLASLTNRQEYEKRLLTFQASTYYAKPPCLSPLFCARFGWQNADKDMLVCAGCNSALAITLNSKLSAKTFDKLCQAYRNKIVTCHATSCPFRLTSSKELPSIEAVTEEPTAMEAKNDESSVQLTVPVYMGQVLPEDSVRLMEHPRPSLLLKKNVKQFTNAIRAFSKDAGFPILRIPSKIREMNKTLGLNKMLDCGDESILALSLLGWKPIPNVALDDSTPILSVGCPCCLAIMDLRFGLRDKTENNENSAEICNEVQPDRFNKRQRIMSRNINPLEAHRHYCPYKVGFPEKAADTNPLWKIILKRLCKEKQDSAETNKGDGTAVEEVATNSSIYDLEKSVGNVQKMLRAGIATR